MLLLENSNSGASFIVVSVDITNFEQNLKSFQEGFSKNYALASSKFSEAIAAIDKSIDQLEKTKRALLKAMNQAKGSATELKADGIVGVTISATSSGFAFSRGHTVIVSGTAVKFE